MEQTTESANNLDKVSGLFENGMPSWLLFVLIGVGIALLIMLFKGKKRFSFFGLLILVAIVFVILAGKGIIDIDKIFSSREQIEQSEQTEEALPEVSEEPAENENPVPTSGIADELSDEIKEENNGFKIDYAALNKIKEGFIDLFTKGR